MASALRRMAQEIAAQCGAVEALVLLGILSRGRPLAERLAQELEAMTGQRPKVGSLATTLYRDDLRSGVRAAKLGGATHFDFDVDGATVIIVDDVIAAGRTARAAMDEVMDYGRPKRIQLACLVDRGLRELPIQPDYCGQRMAAGPRGRVAVMMKETDGEDMVLLTEAPGAGGEDGDG